MSVSFFDKLQEIDAVLQSSDSAQDKHKRVLPLLADPDIDREFWNRLDDPAWVEIVKQGGYLKNPPPPEQVSGGGVIWPRWPVSKFLARVAARAPSEVCAAITRVETTNPSIIADFVDAALAMPTSAAAALIPMLCNAARAELLVLHFKRGSDLCIQLARGGESDAALLLAEALYEPRIEKGRRRSMRGQDYWYDKSLAEVVPLLVAAKPEKTLRMLCRWLDTAVRASNQSHFDPDSDEDTSVVWRPAVEDHEQNRDYELAAVIVGIVRDGFRSAITSDDISLDKALDLLQEHRFPIFTRVRIHLIAEFADKDPHLACTTMLNRKFFDEYNFKHEYARLMGMRFRLLTAEQRATWFGWIDAGPDMTDFDVRIKEFWGRDATEEDRQDRIQTWKFDRLHWVRDYLEGERKAFYTSMLTERGEPELADLHVRMSSRAGSGHASPISREQLEKMSFEGAVDAVAAWRRPKDASFGDAGVDDLARVFGEYVATDPVAYSHEATALRGRPSIYVRRFLDAMHDAVKSGKDIEIGPVLELCQWVVERPVEEQPTSGDADQRMVDKGWRWTRDKIADLIETICNAKMEKKPKYRYSDLGGQLWPILMPLCRDTADSYLGPEEENHDPRSRDYLDSAINSPRGRAVSAAMEYARWIANQIKSAEGAVETVPGGFESMREVREMLEWQLARENRTVVAMSEIGSNLGLLYWIDKEWLGAHVKEIFPLDENPPTQIGWAAWNAAIIWVAPHIEFYRMLRAQFSKAVEHAQRVQLPERARNQPMEHLGQHLVLLYGRGQLGLEDDGGVVRRYLEKAVPELRRKTIDFVGNSLRQDVGLPREVIERFIALWEVYWAGPGPEDAKDNPEAWLFGAWVWSGQFPSQWTLDRLLEFVKVTGKVEPDHGVLEQLEKIAETDIETTVKILTQMVEGDKEGWTVRSWIKPLKSILQVAMKSGGEVEALSRLLIDRLGRLGYTEMGELLRV